MMSIDFHDEINLSIGVTNLDRSVAFFAEKLGFSPLFVDQINRWATLRTPFAGVTLGLSEREQVDEGGGATPTFGVQNIEQSRKSLEDNGVRFGGPTIEIPGVTKFASFFDLDGNAFMLAQKVGPACPSE